MGKRLVLLGMNVFLSFLLLLASTAVPASAADLLTASERSFLRSHGTVIFVSQTNYPPFECIGSDGGREGMCIELARWMATELGFQAKFEDMSFKNAQEAVLSGKADVLTSLFYSEKRDEAFDFTQTMFAVPALIFVKSDRPDIKELRDLNGMRVAMQRGDYAAEYLSSKGISYTLVPTDDFAGATDLVVQGKADAVIGDEQIVLYHLYSHNLTENIKTVGEPLYVGKNSMAMKEGSPLASILHKGIDLAMERGVFDKINRKWVGVQYKSSATWAEIYESEMKLAALSLVAAIALIIFWNVRLQKLVKDRTLDLQLSEEKYRSLSDDALDTSDICMLVVDSAGKVIWTNKAVGSLFGLDQKGVVGGMIEEVLSVKLKGLHPELDATIREILSSYGKNQYLEMLEFSLNTSGNARRWLNYWSKPVTTGLYKGGRIEHFTDVTARKNYENEISLEKELWEKTLNAVPEYIAIIDKDFRILRTNTAMAEKMKLPLGGCAGLTCFECVHNLDRPSEKCPHAMLLADGKAHRVEIFEERLGGMMQVTVVPLIGGDGELIGSVHVAHDITEQKEAERLLTVQRDLNSAVGGCKEIESALLLALNAALEIDDIDAGSAYIMDDATGNIKMVAHHGMSQDLVELCATIKADSPQARLVAKSKPYYYAFSEFSTALGHSEPVVELKASALLPLVHQDKVVAALNISSKKLDGFNNETKHYIESLAIQIAGTIYRINSTQSIYRNQRNLNSLFDAMEDMLFVIGVQGEVIHANKIVEEKLGYTQNEVISMNALAFHPETVKAEAEVVHANVIAGTGHFCPHPFQTSDGRLIPVETIFSHGEWDGKPAIFGVSRDKTAWEEAEAGIRMELAFKKALIESASEGICVCHEIKEYPFVEFTIWNPKMQELVGYTLEEINRLGWYQTVYRDEEVGRRAAERMKTMRQGEDIRGEDWPVTAKNGEQKIVRIFTSLVESKGGAHNALAMMTDVTEEKKAEGILRQSEELFRAVVFNTPVAMGVTDDKQKILYLNGSFEKLFGYTTEDLPTIDFWWPLAYPDPEYRSNVRERWNNMVARTMASKRESQPLEENVVCKGGEVKTIEFRFAYVMGRGITTFTDLTERKRSEEELREYSRTQAVLLREVNHRVKNNLSAIISMMHMEEDRLSPDKDGTDISMLRGIEGRVRSLFAVHSLLSQTQWQPLSLSELCREVVSSTITGISALVRPLLSVEASPLKVDSDQAHYLALVLNELATNTVKYAMPANGEAKISIFLGMAGDLNKLVFQDNGQGVPERVIKGESAIGSIGFGLIKGIVENSLRGTIEISNEDGARIAILFPSHS